MLGYIPTQFKSGTLRGKRMFELYTDEFQLKVKTTNIIKKFIESLDMSQMTGRSAVNKSLYLFDKSILPGYILNVEGDRTQMSHSVEGRLPYLDHPLYEFVRNLPIAMKIKGITEKYLLREAAKDLLTKNVYERVKHPFFSPPASDLTDSHMYLLMQEVFNGDALDKIPFFNKEKVLKLLEKLPHMETKEMLAADSLLVSVLSMCFLQERFQIVYEEKY